MATTTKLSFRARNPDANRATAVYYADELPDLSECTPISRAVTQMPTGMEKEEELELHLQEAMVAQAASTAGITENNHVIPTPKVEPTDENRYNVIYPKLSPPSKSLIRVQAWLTLDKEEAEYDLDSEDEAWLEDKPHISPGDFERIIETLENNSDRAICLPSTARTLLHAFDETVVDDVYDYWLRKREEATTSGGGVLMAHVRSDCRKDASGVINPYVAFRRRAEKMQTRKNRKNDEESYEKVLKIGHDMNKVVTILDMMRRREKTKLALIDHETSILNERFAMGDFGSQLYNQLMSKIRNTSTDSRVPTNGVPLSGEDVASRQKHKRRKIRPIGILDKELPSRAWLKKNLEVWNRAPTPSTLSQGVSQLAEVEKSYAATAEAQADGRYTFKRRRGCSYRSAIHRPLHTEAPDDKLTPSQCDNVPPEMRFYRTLINGCVGAARRRIGRGGRVIFDCLRDLPSSSRNRPLDPFLLDPLVVDNSLTFAPRPSQSPPWGELVEEDSEDESVAVAEWLRLSELSPNASRTSPPRPDCAPSPSSPASPQEEPRVAPPLVQNGHPQTPPPDPPDVNMKDESEVDSRTREATPPRKLSGNAWQGREADNSLNGLRPPRTVGIATKGGRRAAVLEERGEWTPSASPSDDSCSGEWEEPPQPPCKTQALDLYSLRSEEEATRTGDHPRQPARPDDKTLLASAPFLTPPEVS